MAWNRDDGAGRVRRAGSHGASPLKGIVAGAIVVVGAVVAWFALTGRQGEEKSGPTQERGEIADEAPDIVRRPPPAPKPKPVDPNARPTKPFEKLNGYVMLPSGRLHKMTSRVRTNDLARASRPSYAIFEHHVENQISSLLTLAPGETIVGTPRYGEEFVEAFLESLKTPIIVRHDDDEETQRLKRAMIECKKDLKARYDAGEDIAQVMNDTHNEMQKLSLYRQEIEDEVMRAQRDENFTVEDVEDYVKAANIMLEKKGIAPIDLNPVVRQQLELRKEYSK